MDYKKCWNTLRAESGGRWCQPHPMSNELLTIGELMRNMERRDSESEELSTTDVQQLKAKIGSIEQYAYEQLRLKMNPSDIVLAVAAKLSQLSAV
jgi:hypothetical protein